MLKIHGDVSVAYAVEIKHEAVFNCMLNNNADILYKDFGGSMLRDAVAAYMVTEHRE